MLNECFVARRGLAMGMMQAAAGLTGTAMPFALTALLDIYGYAKALRIVAIAIVVLTGPMLPALKGRLPVPQNIGNRETTLLFSQEPPLLLLFHLGLSSGSRKFLPYPVSVLLRQQFRLRGFRRRTASCSFLLWAGFRTGCEWLSVRQMCTSSNSHFYVSIRVLSMYSHQLGPGPVFPSAGCLLVTLWLLWRWLCTYISQPLSP